MFESKRLGTFWETIIEFPLVVAGLPYLLPLALRGFKVKGELYEVDTECLRALDMLEGHPHWYIRRPVMLQSVGASPNAVPLEAQTYFMIDFELYHEFSSTKLRPTAWFTNHNQPEPF